jgi:hypothetical protein
MQDPNPNWDDYMDPDEMEAFEMWQQEQAAAEEEEGWGDEMADPADIPLCSDFSRTGNCMKGDDCPLIHGDECEVSMWCRACAKGVSQVIQVPEGHG